MVAGILGEKVGMTRMFAKNGESIPVTVILAGRPLSSNTEENYRKGWL
jgi:ribosomal protein L3